MTDTRSLDPALFGDAAIDAETAKLNAQMIEQLTGQPEWWVVGAQAMRAARRRGEGPFPAPVMSSRARTLTITASHDRPPYPCEPSGGAHRAGAVSAAGLGMAARRRAARQCAPRAGGCRMDTPAAVQPGTGRPRGDWEASPRLWEAEP